MDINTPFITDETTLKILNDNCRGLMKYTLMNDFLSKYSLQKDLFALKGLLAALLRVDVNEITSITILNPVEPGDTIYDKECILDIKLELNNSKIINVEIQERYQDFWPERSITYLCRNFDQLGSGGTYSSIKPCIHIGILNHSLFSKNDPRYTNDFYSEYKLLHSGKYTEYSSKFEIRVLSLNQLENASDEDKNDPNGLYHWAKLFKSSSWEDLKMEAQNNPMMTSFVGTVMQLSAEEKVAQACERRRRYSNDIATYEEEISTSTAQIAELNAEIADKSAELADKIAELADKNAELADKNAEIERLRKLLDASEKKG